MVTDSLVYDMQFTGLNKCIFQGERKSHGNIEGELQNASSWFFNSYILIDVAYIRKVGSIAFMLVFVI